MQIEFGDTQSLAERLTDVRVIQRILEKSVRAALLNHKRFKNPVAIWMDGRVVWLSPDDIPVSDEEA